MRLYLVRAEEYRAPARGLVQTLIGIQQLEAPLSLDDICPYFTSRSGAKVFLVRAEAEGLLLRGERNQYYPVSPNVALLSSLLPMYYKSLWRMHDILDGASVAHAFACLTTASVADYLPNSPILAVAEEDLPRFVKADVFGLAIDKEALISRSSTVSFEWPDGSDAFTLRELDAEWTSLILGAIGLPREVAAARRLLETMEEVDDSAARRLNAYGLSPRRDILEKEASVLVPPHFDEMRSRYAEALRQFQVREGGL